MNLETACINLIRYIEDHRDDFREKPSKMSWYQYLSSDIYAKKMLSEVSKYANQFMRTRAAVLRENGETLSIRNAVEDSGKSDTHPLHNHRVTISESTGTSATNSWAKGVIILDVAMSAKYTASVRVLF